MKTPWIVLAALVLVPTSLADSGSYVGAGVVTGFCTSGDIGSDTGIVCELSCVGSCVVTMSDDLLGENGAFQVCDWDAATASDVHCSDPIFGQTAWSSRTGVIDVFVMVGTTGVVTTS